MGITIEKIRKQAIGHDLQKFLDKPYQPCSKIDAVFRGNELTMVTDKEGKVNVLYMGKRNPDGSIRGERFARHNKKLPNGTIASRWECKGKTSGF